MRSALLVLLACGLGAACSASERTGSLFGGAPAPPGARRADRGTPQPASGVSALIPPAPPTAPLARATAAPVVQVVARLPAEPAPEPLHEVEAATPEYSEPT